MLRSSTQPPTARTFWTALAAALCLACCAGTAAAAPLRLIPELDRCLRETAPAPLRVPLDHAWRGLDARLIPAQEGLQFVGRASESGMALDLVFDTAAYNTLRVRMKVDCGSACTFAWRSDLEPGDFSEGNYRSLRAPILTHGSFQTYTFALGQHAEEIWAGQIQEVFFIPADGSATAVISSFELSFEPPPAPKRITLGEVTFEARYGTQPPWPLQVPEGAIFEAHAGMLPRAWENTQPGDATFRVTLDSPDEQGLILLEQRLSPGAVLDHRSWVPLRADLSRFAGQGVALRLTIDPGDSPVHDYAFWGNPMILSSVPGPADIPVVLISHDTLRADHLSCYGYTRQTSPNLDHFAGEEAVLFENAIASVTFTPESHMTMLTGLYPKHHKVSDYTSLAETVVTLPEWLQEHGYLTAAFTGHGWWLMPWRGFAQGFDLYDIPSGMFRHVNETLERSRRWLEAHPVPRRFLFFHNYDLHRKIGNRKHRLPYDPQDPAFTKFSRRFLDEPLFSEGPKAALSAHELLDAHEAGDITFTTREHEALVALYDDAIRLVDQRMADLFEILKTQGLYDPALIIVTADHGECLNEHGFYGHRNVYEPECRVPLLLKFPNGEFAGQRFTPQVELTDLYATVCDVLGLTPTPPVDGQSLRAVLRGDAAPRPYAYVDRKRKHAVRTNEWKMHWTQLPNEEIFKFFHLSTDPAEQHDRYAEAPKPLERFHTELRRFFQADTEGWHLRFILPKKPWEGEVLVSSDEPLAACYRLDANGFADPLLPGNDNVLRVRMDASEWRHFLVQTGSSLGRLQVTLRADNPFTVYAGQQPPQTALLFRSTLDPASERYAEPSIAADNRIPALLIWFEASDARREAAPAPSAETREALEALGYLND